MQLHADEEIPVCVCDVPDAHVWKSAAGSTVSANAELAGQL